MIQDSQTPMKVIKAPRKRKADAVVENDVDLFGEWQTTDFVPAPVVNGKIPQNAYGNIEVFHENMIPKGCVWIPIAGSAVVAKKLGIEYVKVVTGFEYHSRQATPQVQGILVLEQDEILIREAAYENKQYLTQLDAEKREKRVYTRWKKLIMGIQSRQRIMDSYMKD